MLTFHNSEFACFPVAMLFTCQISPTSLHSLLPKLSLLAANSTQFYPCVTEGSLYCQVDWVWGYMPAFLIAYLSYGTDLSALVQFN